MKNLKTAFAVTAVLALSLTGAFAAAPVNTKCPVKGKDVEGKKTSEVSVTFCCEKCQAKFDEEPSKYISKVASAEEGKCPISGKDADAEVKSTFTVGICCGKCQKEFESDPKKYLKKL